MRDFEVQKKIEREVSERNTALTHMQHDHSFYFSRNFGVDGGGKTCAFNAASHTHAMSERLSKTGNKVQDRLES